MRQAIAKGIYKGLFVAGLLASLMIYNSFTGHSQTVEWPTGPNTERTN